MTLCRRISGFSVQLARVEGLTLIGHVDLADQTMASTSGGSCGRALCRLYHCAAGGACLCQWRGRGSLPH